MTWVSLRGDCQQETSLPREIWHMKALCPPPPDCNPSAPILGHFIFLFRLGVFRQSTTISPGWPGTRCVDQTGLLSQSSHLCFLSARTTSVHHTQLPITCILDTCSRCLWGVLAHRMTHLLQGTSNRWFHNLCQPPLSGQHGNTSTFSKVAQGHRAGFRYNVKVHGGYHAQKQCSSDGEWDPWLGMAASGL